jgi:hypothetical protein
LKAVDYRLQATGRLNLRTVIFGPRSGPGEGNHFGKNPREERGWLALRMSHPLRQDGRMIQACPNIKTVKEATGTDW